MPLLEEPKVLHSKYFPVEKAVNKQNTRRHGVDFNFSLYYNLFVVSIMFVFDFWIKTPILSHLQSDVKS